MLTRLKVIAVVAAVTISCGCASYSATKTDFGNSVENMISKQSVGTGGALAADEPINHGDGVRLMGVDSVYTSNVGDPSPVVRQAPAQRMGEGG